MSTYNGERFLREQLDSIYAQEGVDVGVLVRDDGSTDGTCRLLSEEQRKGNLTWYSGENKKPARSFLTLLMDAPEADLYAFSDQDDVWKSDKLRAAAEAIGAEEGPALYFCQTRLVDERLRDLHQVPISPRVTYGEALVYQFVGGCTMVMNARMRDIVNQYTPSYLRMHDVWVYDIALAVGARVVWDPEAHILYRQHGSNQVGQTSSALANWKLRCTRTLAGEHIRLQTARELLRGYAHLMSEENRRLTERLVDYRSSIKAKLSLMCDKRLRPANSTIWLTSRMALATNTF